VSAGGGASSASAGHDTAARERGQPFDFVLVGGGLQHALLVLALHQIEPALRLALVETHESLGGNHTWCFHASDVSRAAESFVAPLVEHSWPGYSVRFPRLERRVASRYAMISSARLHQVLCEHFARHPASVLALGVSATSIEASSVRLSDGRELAGKVVSDARGPERTQREGPFAYQKFLGLELELEAPSPLDEPLLMDARVSQHAGFRFVYVLPFSERRVLIEDTYYSESPELDRAALRAEVLAYAAAHGFRVRDVLREEQGVLPIPLASRRPEASARPLRLGYGGGWFHPTTGYSLPIAARLAHAIATSPVDALPERLEQLASEHARQARYCVLLNRLMFGAFGLEAQRNVLERFYRLPEPTIERFYALLLSHADQLRILCGRPPSGLSLRRALSREARA
jgi:lycopene beta-cyclase